MQPKPFYLRGLCLVLCLVCLTLAACKKGPAPSDVPLSPGLSLIEGEPIYDEGVALRSDSYTVTDGMLAYCFYGYGLEVMRTMEQTKPYDSSKNLHDQMYNETESWYDTIMNAVLARISQVLVYCEGAKRAGADTIDDQMRESIEADLTQLRYIAAAQYSESLDSYLSRSYGPLVSESDVTRILELEAIATSYSTRINEELENGITEDEAHAYASAHSLSDESPSRSVVVLVITGNGADEIASNAAAAEAALKASPKEATAMALTQYGKPICEKNLISENTGIEAVKEWLFADGREVGDVGTVTSGSDTLVLLYTGHGMSRGEVLARMGLFDERFAAWYNGVVESLHFGYNYTVIDSYDVEK